MQAMPHSKVRRDQNRRILLDPPTFRGVITIPTVQRLAMTLEDLISDRHERILTTSTLRCQSTRVLPANSIDVPPNGQRDTE